ncbi:GGDEF domain-containing protein [Paraglaciecola aquimarina]|uniref:diguanylate cyclase n=1 Tax=Paraglaciecola algarum TaxID=3050085 RepID=A0ABS9D6R4_9ALTE|nr:GGDEF domain-containing protein [Paraglaciecola sp. G1-23]MCF2948657.1 GGDEF domain-containing protein [Paraglaciecola sp. G1-23]
MAIDSSLAEMHWKHDLLGSIEVGIVVLDKKYNVQVWNQFMENHSNIVPGMIQDKCVFDVFPDIDKDWFMRKAEPAFTLKSPVFVIWEQRPYLFKFDCNRPITSPVSHMYQNITIFPLASLSGAVEQICIIIYDATNEAINRLGVQELNAQIEEISRIDTLTTLLNRRYWLEQFDLEFKREKRTENPSSLMILDIDNMKGINDTYGYPAGDTIINGLGKVIEKATRETDVCCRYEGQKFAVLMPDTPVANVEFLAQRIRRLVEKFTVVHDQINLNFTISIGIAGFIPTYTECSQWFKVADNALRQAKEAGRNNVFVAE